MPIDVLFANDVKCVGVEGFVKQHMDQLVKRKSLVILLVVYVTT